MTVVFNAGRNLLTFNKTCKTLNTRFRVQILQREREQKQKNFVNLK